MWRLFASVVGLSVVLISTAQAEGLVIGVAGPLSGSEAALGAQMVEGVKTAVTDLVSAGRLPMGTRVAIADDQCDPKLAPTAARQLLGEGAQFVVGHFCSGASMKAAPIYQAGGALMISPAASNPLLTDNRAGGNIFRMASRDDMAGIFVGQWLAKKVGPGGRIVVAHTDDGGFGKMLSSGIERGVRESGATVALSDVTGTSDTTIREIAARAPTAVVLAGYGDSAGRLANALRQANMTVPLFGGDALLADSFLAGGGAEGVLALSSPDWGRLGAARGVAGKIRAPQSFGTDAYAYSSYAAVQVIAEAMAMSGGTSVSGVAQALSAGSFQTVIGEVMFNDKGDLRTQSFGWYKLTSGGPRYVENDPDLAQLVSEQGRLAEQRKVEAERKRKEEAAAEERRRRERQEAEQRDRQEQERRLKNVDVGDAVCSWRYSNNSGWCGSVEDVRGQKLRVEVQDVTVNGFMATQLNASECTGNKSLRFNDVGSLIWVPKSCIDRVK